MKLSSGITLFNKQVSNVHKIHKNEILEKNSNISVPILDNTNNNPKKNKKYIERKEKVTLIKSFYNKNERNSKSKSNSKECKKRHKSNNSNININQNIYFNNNTSYNQNQMYNNKNKYIFSSYILTPLLSLKIYENVVKKIFEYIKNILPKKIYIDIKKMYIKYIFEELHIKTNILLIKTDVEIMNINLKLFYNKNSSVSNSNSKNKKKKELSFTRNHINNKSMNNCSNNTVKSNISKQFNGLMKNHNSLYSLNKGYPKIQGAPFYFNLSKSPLKSKSKSKSGSKEKKLVKNEKKNYHSNNNIFDPDLHVFKILNQRKKNNRINKNLSNNSKNKKIKKQLNSNFILNKKIKNNNINKNKTSNLILYSEKKNENINKNNSIKIEENNNKILEKKFAGNNSNKNENHKNDELLKQIKSDLDENLKFLFNFSYENFLNKESESTSKKSVNDYHNF